MLSRFSQACCSAALLGCVFAGSARAAERITLSNGFELECDHRGGLDASTGKLRLFFDAGESHYLDVVPAEITASEHFDPPLAPAPAVTPVAMAAAPASHPLTPGELHELLATNGQQHNLSVDLLASVVHAESSGNPHATSHAGARGLMQLMPATAAELGVTDALAPDQNVRGGTDYLDALLHRYHDNLALALAAYNAGPGAVDRYHGVPPYRETQLYVARIIREFNRRYDAANPSPIAAR